MIARKKPAVSTPWGAADSQEVCAPGIICYGTPSHGGYHLDDARMARLRKLFPGFKTFAGGPWFEEDCDWCVVALAFPEAFKATAQESAESTLRHYQPDVWEAHYGRKLLSGESRARDREVFAAEHANDLIVTSAIGQVSWKPHIAEGMVEVTATVGGNMAADGFVHSAKLFRKFMVTSEEYGQRGPFGFIVDPTRHPEIIEVSA